MIERITRQPSRWMGSSRKEEQQFFQSEVVPRDSLLKDLLHYRCASLWKKEEYALATLLDHQSKLWATDIKQQNGGWIAMLANFPSHAAATNEEGLASTEGSHMDQEETSKMHSIPNSSTSSCFLVFTSLTPATTGQTF